MDETLRDTPASHRLDSRADEREAFLHDLAERWSSHDLQRMKVEQQLLVHCSADHVEVLTLLASNGELSCLADFVKGLSQKQDANPRWCATLGFLLIAHGLDKKRGLSLLEFAIGKLGPSPESDHYVRALIGTLVLRGEQTGAKRLLSNHPAHAARISPFLKCDLHEIGKQPAQWLKHWSEAFRYNDVTTPGIDVTSQSPIFSLTASSALSKAAGPLVSIVIDEADFSFGHPKWSLISILDQTWTNLQVLVVASESSHLAEVGRNFQKRDPRIDLLKTPPNLPWAQRERTILEAISGQFVTWLTGDHWLHPEKIECQARLLIEQDDKAWVVVKKLSADSSLIFSNPSGAAPEIDRTSVMVRAHDYLGVNGRLGLGMLSYEELSDRITKVTGRRGIESSKPLVVELRPHNSKPLRSGIKTENEIRGLFRHWHMSTSHTAMRGGTDKAPVGLKQIEETGLVPGSIDCDVLLLGDWVQFGGPQKSMLEEVNALTQAGYTVCIMHSQPSRFLASAKTALCPQVAELILNGKVRLAGHQDKISAQVTFMRYPPILALGHPKIQVKQKKLVIVANQAPSERDGTDIRYRVEDVREHAVRSLGSPALWAPQGPQVREPLIGRVPEGELLSFDLPGIINTDLWVQERSRRRSTIPVIGRHSRDNPMKWPDTAEELLQVYPDSRAYDVRTMGGAEALKALLEEGPPSRWLVFEKDELPVRTFLNSLDFFVYFQHSEAFDAFGRAVLEALATGVLTVLPHRMRPVFGDAAVYAAPEEVLSTVEYFHTNRSAYARQSQRSLEHVRANFSYQAHVARVESIVKSSTNLY